jgi:hypothetical protein
MRGDSLRDLYAKTLALLGLGVLAGAGALVDYWPSGVALPAVDAGLVQPELARSLPVPDRQPNLDVPARRPRIAPPVVAVVEPAPREFVIPETPRLALATVSAAWLTPAVFTAPPVSVPVQAFAVTDDYTLGEEVALTDPTPWPTTTLAMSAPPVEMSEDETFGGRLTGMVKRTGTSIARTGRRTGASIVEAFRVVSGAVRRALPN